jgi:uncharacterized membrane protein (DUF485 family)
VVNEHPAARVVRVDAAALLRDPRVQRLIAARRRKYVALSTLISSVYAVVAAGCAFAPAFLARPVIGSAVSLGIVSMAAVMLIGIACAGYYVWWSNTVRDRLHDEAVRTATRSSS